MDNYAVIGKPIHHSMSPFLHNAHFEQQDDAAYYTAYEVDLSELEQTVDAFKTLKVRGWNVTVPHKIAIMPFLDELSEEAARIGAVNTVVQVDGKLIGYNTDSRGYLNALLSMTGQSLKEMNVLVVGAGGASRAVVYGLMDYGVTNLSVTNRTALKIEEMQRDFIEVGTVNSLTFAKANECLEQFDLVINTTSIGLNGEDLDFLASSKLKEGVYLSDLIYNPEITTWLSTNKHKARAIQNGLGMFVEQAALAYEYWTGKRADRPVMENLVKRKLGIEHEVNK
ncbi:shikimate dehydrogenase [Geomicrobium sediminis]|uniref:Shikimate dehydrogenase (NADP(+)) n=1 Tax=Geomicrobium sediminis TaxID=1347788 RepID=A0ABS2PEF1_9BACL|nr:shikimate dehydrogenase [Geomicrobium sediminis]MBM7633788.1 shikimate dehydrogenase [Geomicrobium sediminis]